jgi:hypothetical protein
MYDSTSKEAIKTVELAENVFERVKYHQRK